ncbi:peroxidase 64 [Dorcoceras hygrometricum]|uniref:Peroxidase 64 n=1 Tax=Dorcoceras hygrometricum TaxID=472368 RepID=A0A2Z7CPZ8_9LAMI|nr:peroxidase 64 [Dorcoceras hygrometricum]
MHKCAFKLIHVALLEDEWGEDTTTEETTEERHELEEDDKDCGTLELPLFSISGVSQPQTLKLRGWILGEEVVIMVDSGASHNFFSRPLIEKLGIPIEETVRFDVCLGDGGKVRCQGVCRNLKVELGMYTVVVTGHLFELGDVDVILGVDWLRTLGEVMLDWNKMRMRFAEGERVIELKGYPSLQRAVVSLKSLCKITEVEFSATIFTIEKTEQRGGDTGAGNYPRELQEIICKYGMIFAKPQGLPPSRSQDHAINIKEGYGPVQVRPYRYAHRQKNEIEKLVTEMQTAGVIHPSNSPYSISVILVKKKDES